MDEMSNTQSTEGGQLGSTDHPQHRAPEGEGFRSDSPGQYSIYDGKGNETVVSLDEGAEGKPKLGTGPTAADAQKDVGSDEPIGEGFFPPPE